MNQFAGQEEDGFALLETIVALFILAVALTIGSTTISTSLATISRSRDLTKSSEILQHLASTAIYAIDDTGVRKGGYGQVATWTIGAEQIRDDNQRPLFLVTVRIRPRGNAGPELVYETFASNAAGAQ